MNELDALLQAPLTDIADNGFTGRLMLRIEKQRLRRQATELAVWPLALLGTLCAVLMTGLDVGTLRKLFYAFGDPTGQLSISLCHMGNMLFQPFSLVLLVVLLVSMRADRIWARL